MFSCYICKIYIFNWTLTFRHNLNIHNFLFCWYFFSFVHSFKISCKVVVIWIKIDWVIYIYLYKVLQDWQIVRCICNKVNQWNQNTYFILFEDSQFFKLYIFCTIIDFYRKLNSFSRMIFFVYSIDMTNGT
jgi:hypothetical protein